jgi:uncharacterized protein YbjT (DUF2867 family)
VESGSSRRTVFVAGATGFMGARLIPMLLERGHAVKGLARPGSEGKLPQSCTAVVGTAIEAASYAASVAPADTFVHLVGVAHPNPSKAAEFRAIDLASLRASVEAAMQAGARHFVFVSVAQPAPIMKAYIAVRAECEGIIASSGMNATILRPWYVVGPGRWWPYVLLPGYWLGELLPFTRDAARRLGLVTWRQMIAAMVAAIEDPPQGTRILDVAAIRTAGSKEVGK